MRAHVLAIALAASSAAKAETPPQSATESYRGRIVRDVRLLYEGELPEASGDLVELVVGEPYQPEAVRRSIRQLFALGAFSDIKVEAEPAGDEVDVRFRLYPSLEVAGVELAGLGPGLEGLERRLEQASRIEPGAPLDLGALREGAARMVEVLHREGYLWAAVEPEASLESPAARVVFHVEPGARARVRSMRVEGVAPRTQSHVISRVELDEGSFYSRAELERRLERLTAEWKDRDYYAASVEIDETVDVAGWVDVRLLPRLGPRIAVEVVGIDLSNGKLEDLVPILGEARFTPDLVEEGRANIESHLREQGYRNASVAVERESVAGSGALVLRFVVEPGQRYEVQGITFEGLDSLPEAELRALLASRSRGPLRGGPFRQEVWEDDLREIRDYLRRRGFHEAEVEGFERLASEDASSLVLVVLVREGPRAVVDSVTVEGAEEVGGKRALESAGIEPGRPFNASEVVAARRRIVNLYRNEGFRNAEVAVETTLDASKTLASVSFRIREGLRTRVDRVIVSGLEVTRESTVDGLIQIQPGTPLSSRDVMETRQRLVGSGLFRRVEIEILPMDPLTRSSDVLISLEEGPRTTFAYGFGYQEQQLARAEAEVTRRNLLGLNRTVSVFARASFRGGRFITTYRQPDTFGLEVPLFVSGFAEEERRTSFDFNRVGLGLQVVKSVSPDQRMLFRYRFDRTKVFNLEVDIDEIDRRFRTVLISALSVASLTDKRDDPLNPSRGQYRILDMEWSSELLGTEAPYLKGFAQQFFYFSLPHEMVAAVGLRLGMGKTLRLDRDALIPIAERFFAGGATTLRGFGLDEASPKRKLTLPNGDVVDGEPIGGNVLSLLNLELRFPILGNLRGVLFSDNGNVYRRLEIIELLNWRYNMGFGFRYETPLGPLRVDYGFKLDRRTLRSVDCPDVQLPCREPFGQWHVSLGHAF